MKIRHTGIADEGAKYLAEQIAIHRELGWDSLEIRSIEEGNICEIPDSSFDKAEELIKAENMKVAGFASAIASWARPIEGDFEKDRSDLLRAAPRMHRLGTEFLRIMSYSRGSSEEDYWKSEALRRVRELTRMAEGEGITLIHENCEGWASAEPENLKILLEEIPSESLKIVFDMGNPLDHGHPEEKVWDFLKACEDRVVHIHIKDCYKDANGNTVHCFPGEGRCFVRETVEYMVSRRNYSGYVSIEPHMVFHFSEGSDSAEAAAAKRKNYSAYAEKSMELLKDIREPSSVSG